MNQHQLSDAWREFGMYAARCGCGLNIWARTLPALWEQHDRHLDAVRAQSQRRHPSQWRPKW